MAEQPAPRPPRAAHVAANNNNNNNQQHEYLLLESINDYNRNRENHVGYLPPEGFQHPDAYFEDADYTANKESEGRKHEESFFETAFAEDDEREEFVKAEKDRFLDSLRGKTIVVIMSRTGGGGGGGGGGEHTTTREVPLDVVAASCDTVLQMVKSKILHDNAKSGSTKITSEEQQQQQEKQCTLDLQNFPLIAVECFFSIIISSKPLSKISEDRIVDICRISHYVQCNTVFEECIDIIKSSINSENCLSICYLADTLDVPTLFEASVTHLINRLDYIQQDEHWVEFPTYLRDKIITMRNVVQSSILGRGQKASIFFGSSNEFLAIFSDNIHEQQERLDEAKQRQEQIINERIIQKRRGGGQQQQQRGDWFGRCVMDAERKIERQTKRLKTLESFYNEQKLIFAKSS